MTYDLNEHNRVLALTTAQEKAIKDYIELRSHFYSNSMKYSQEINYKDYEKPLYHESLFPDSDEYFIYFHPLSKEPSSPIKLHIPLSQSKEQMLLVANMINQLQLGDIINQAKIVNPELPSISSNFSNFARVQNSSPITIYFKKSATPEQIAYTIQQIDLRLQEAGKYLPVSTGPTAESDQKISHYCAVTIDHDEKNTYVGGHKPEDIQKRQNILEKSSELKQVRDLLKKPLKKPNVEKSVKPEKNTPLSSGEKKSLLHFFVAKKERSEILDKPKPVVKAPLKSAFETQLDYFSDSMSKINVALQDLIKNGHLKGDQIPKGLTSNIQLLRLDFQQNKRISDDMINKLNSTMNGLKEIEKLRFAGDANLKGDIRMATRMYDEYLIPMNPKMQTEPKSDHKKGLKK